MKKLKTRLRVAGWDLEQVARSEHYAVYRQSKKSSNNHAWEVVAIHVAPPHPEYYLGTNKIDACSEPQECYPSTNQWGGQAWTCTSLDRAMQKFRQLNETCGGVGRRASSGNSAPLQNDAPTQKPGE